MKKSKQHNPFPHLLPFLCFVMLILAPSSNVVVSGAGEYSGDKNHPFTPKASLIRYWKKQISNDLPKPWFLLNKASPMSPIEMATFSKLVDQNSLSTNLPSFCKSANLLCFDDLSPSLEKHPNDVKFSVYSEKNFTNYGNDKLGNADSFKNYSNGENIPVTTFRRYSRDSTGHHDKFSSYGVETNVVDQSFNTYGTSATGGAGEFSSYNDKSNVPNLRFTSYSSDANGRKQGFTSYNTDTNAGDQSFTSYGKNGNGADHDFSSYGKNSNVIGSGFSNYGQTGNGANDTFTSYGFNGNVPQNNFKNYGDGGNAASETFKTYRDQSNVGDDSFTSYAKNSNSAEVKFTNYGKSFNEGTDKFTGYGQNAKGHTVGFKTYGVNNTFKEYAQKGVSFSNYMNKSSEVLASLAAESGNKVNNRWVEPGKFFREKMLKSGVVMPMPDIADKMPKRSFLPRLISSKLPFSTSKIGELKKIFHAADDSSMNRMLVDTLSECERAPSAGENKRCVSSAEDMIDFATTVLGRNVAVRTTENTKGSKGNIMIGSVKGINGGKVTKSVSCHQSLFPYLLYYCHSVPKVRVYQADLLDPQSKAKINHGVAICHVDTSSWSSNHGAFIALGSGPGKIEVCHWIFENDMTWAVADS
ncbi:hypothetical protein Leryth_025745 [Lithospermum erythrorhizon]|nr:hypothetical protein Leryth_025745 [Lithospermum erythrorhizon]